VNVAAIERKIFVEVRKNSWQQQFDNPPYDPSIHKAIIFVATDSIDSAAIGLYF
jgi:hypothetical protein